MKILSFIWYCYENVSKVLNKVVTCPIKKSLLKKCGSNVTICRGVKAYGWDHIKVGNDVSIGDNCFFMTTLANIEIGNHVMFAPYVKIITGGHRIDFVGKYMDEVSEKEKKGTEDKDIIFEGDNWIGCNVVILKGVKVGKGSVIGSNSLVIKDVPPFAIVSGNPATVIGKRFSDDILEKHCKMLQDRDKK